MEKAPVLDTVRRELYWDGFNELHSERSIGMSLGPIPYHAICFYADRNGFDKKLGIAFQHVIRNLDNHYLSHEHKKASSKKR